MVDMGAASTFNELVLNSVNSANDYPRGYQVSVSADGINWGNPIATGSGTSGTTTVPLAPQAARYIRITQTGSANGTFWSIDEFNVMGTVPTVPAAPIATSVSGSEISLSWNPSVSASGYNVKRSVTGSGNYVVVATNLPYLNYADTGLTAGTAYYYVISATNSFGESANSPSVSVMPVSLTPVQLGFALNAGQVQMTWPQDHTGWTLQVQTNTASAGLGTNWVTVPMSRATNQIGFPIDSTPGSVFFRLISP
jgi:hypothetical protein